MKKFREVLNEANKETAGHEWQAQQHKAAADKLPKNSAKWHFAMAAHHESMSEYHSSNGHHNLAAHHDEKAERHIEKAHGVNEDVKQIDEISDEMKNRYVAKATRHVEALRADANKSEKHGLHLRAYANRDKAWTRERKVMNVQKKLGEEVETLEEGGKHQPHHIKKITYRTYPITKGSKTVVHSVTFHHRNGEKHERSNTNLQALKDYVTGYAGPRHKVDWTNPKKED